MFDLIYLLEKLHQVIAVRHRFYNKVYFGLSVIVDTYHILTPTQ